MTADWLQGPYVYALYSSYGFSKHDIAVLFVGGFGASMLFGTFIGAAADKLGRKRLCQVYCILYFLSCVTKHARDYWVLMVGRVLGGIATSLLFSSFESWMVCEHNARGYDAAALNDTFSLMYFGKTSYILHPTSYILHSFYLYLCPAHTTDQPRSQVTPSAPSSPV